MTVSLTNYSESSVQKHQDLKLQVRIKLIATTGNEDSTVAAKTKESVITKCPQGSRPLLALERLLKKRSP